MKELLSDKLVHVYGITESHLNTSITDEEITVDGYYIERLDRTSGSHGGVVCFIRNDIIYERRKDLETKGIETIWLEISMPNSTPTLICFMYRPPDTSRYLDTLKL